MITKVQVLDSEFSVLQLISDQHDLELVEQEWSKLEKNDSLRNHDWTHTIDITSETIGGRWSYNSSGYLAKLNKTLTLAYRVKDVRQFNKIVLGL